MQIIFAYLALSGSMRRFFGAPKTHVKTDGYKNINNCMLKFFAYLIIWTYGTQAHMVQCNKNHRQVLAFNKNRVNFLKKAINPKWKRTYSIKL